MPGSSLPIREVAVCSSNVVETKHVLIVRYILPVSWDCTASTPPCTLRLKNSLPSFLLSDFFTEITFTMMLGFNFSGTGYSIPRVSTGVFSGGGTRKQTHASKNSIDSIDKFCGTNRWGFRKKCQYPGDSALSRCFLGCF